MKRSHAFLRLAGAVAIVALASGCTPKDTRLKQLSAGIRGDSILKVMGVEAPERKDAYILDGTRIEAWYFVYRDLTDSASLMDRNMSPLVLVDSTLAAWGWHQWDSIASAKKIPVAPPQ